MREPNFTARQNLDDRLRPLRDTPPTPVRGWIRAIREALGMSTSDVAARLDTTKQTISRMERAEIDGSIRLDTLRRVAGAFDCTLVYALVPNSSLEEVVERRAYDIALRDLGRVRQTMLLEDQLVDDDVTQRRLIDELAEEIKGSPRLWRA
jgi:predicted DNA-binding mobile mystery protein A